MFTPKYLMVFDHDITLESLATILHLTLWRGPMRRQILSSARLTAAGNIIGRVNEFVSDNRLAV